MLINARTRIPPWVFVAIGQLASFAIIARVRFVDGDEGSLLEASALALDGYVPYIDFIHPQMPLFPYVYGTWAELTGESWFGARLLSSVLAALVGTMLFEHARRRYGVVASAVALTLYATSALVLTWFPIAKTYVLMTVFIVAAMVILEGRPATTRRVLGVGLLVGLAIDVRLLAAAVVPAFAFDILRRHDAITRGRAFGALAVGLTLGLAPSLILLAVSPDRFLFANLGIHSVRSAGGLIGDLQQKAHVAENLLGLGTPADGEPQFVLLLASAVAAAAAAVVARRFSLSLAIAALLAIACFLPTPTYSQYFCTTVPFLALAVAETVAGLRRHTASLATVLALYAALGLLSVARTVRLYPDQRLTVIEQVADALDARTRPGQHVIASWPGYLFGSHAQPVPGTEFDFAPRAAAEVSAERARRSKLLTAAEVERLVESRTARIVVVKRWHTVGPIPDWEHATQHGGYRKAATLGSRGRAEVGGPVVIYERDD